jgi:hypothetical protein
MDRAGVELAATEDEEAAGPEKAEGLPSPPVSEEKLSVFRDFINSLDIDDLGKKGED